MSKKMGKQEKVNLEDWKNIVIGTDVNCYLSERTCDVIMLVEKYTDHTFLMNQFVYGYQFQRFSSVKCLSYKMLLEDLQNPGAIEDNDSLIEQIFKYSAQEAEFYIKNREIIPLDLMSLFIKIEIMRIMERDLKMEKQKVYKLMIEAAKQRSETVIKDFKGQERKKEKNGKLEGKKSERNFCNDKILLNGDEKHKELCMESINIPYKHLLITMVGFIEADLLTSLLATGTPVTCILEVSSDENVLINSNPSFRSLQYYQFYTLSKLPNDAVIPPFEEEEEEEKEGKLSMLYAISDILRSMGSLRSNIDYSTSNLTDVPEDLSKTCSTTTVEEIIPHDAGYFPLSIFWKRIYDFFQSDDQYQHLENTFHMKYLYKDSNHTDEENGELVENECKKVFQTMANFIREVPKVIQQHITYIKRMKLFKLDSDIDSLSSKPLKVYSKMMVKVPPECFTPALLLHCLMEEVCIQNRISSIENDNISTGNCISVKQESKTIFEGTHRTPKYLKPFLSNTRETHIMNMRSKYSKLVERVEPKAQENMSKENVEKSPQAVCIKRKIVSFEKQEDFVTKKNIKLVLRPFTVHEDNRFEIMFNCYERELAKDLFHINMNSLTRLPSLLFLKQKSVDTMKKLLDEKDLQEYSRQLGITFSTLVNVIHLLLFSIYMRNENRSRTSKVLEEKFVTRTVSACLRDEMTRIIDVNSKSGKDYSIYTDDIVDKNSFNKTCQQRARTLKVPFINLYGIRYCENIVDCVLLQDLYSAQNEFPFFQYKYVPLTDSLLIHFYESFDKYGTCTRVFNQSIRVPVCIRDFCRFVTHSENAWLRNEEKKYRNNSETDKYTEREAKFTCPDPVLDRKDQKRKPSQESKSNESVQSRMETVSPVCAFPGEPFDFIGYDLGRKQVQLGGSETALYSQDGIKVLVDKTRWLGGKKNLTIKIDALRNLLVFHLPEKNEDEIYFRFSLLDETTIVFSKPREDHDPNPVMCQKYYRSLIKKKGKPASSFKKRQKIIFCVCQKFERRIKPFRVPFITKKATSYDNFPFEYFFKHLQSLNSKIKLKFDVKEKDVKKQTKELKEDEVKETLWDDYKEEERQTIGNLYSGLTEDLEEFDEKSNEIVLQKLQPSVILRKQYQSFCSYEPNTTCTTLPNFFTKRSKRIRKQNCLLQNLKRDRLFSMFDLKNNTNYPNLKIISSQLHKDRYAKKIKTKVEIPLGKDIKKTVFLNSTLPKPRRYLDIRKYYPVILHDKKNKVRVQSSYEIKISMLSGLMIVTIPSIDDAPFQIKQFYLDKGPACKMIMDEEYRIFYENKIIIKRCSGCYEILCSDGAKISFEMPCFRKRESMKFMLPVKSKNLNENNVCLRDRRYKTPKKVRRSRKLILRLQKHLINASKCLFYNHRKKSAYLKDKKEAEKVPLVPKDIFPFIEFEMVTTNGKHIRGKVDKCVTAENLYVGRTIDCNTNEVLFERVDGMQSLLNNEGVIITQFPDGSRIKSYAVCNENDVIRIDDSSEDLTEIPWNNVQDHFRSREKSAENSEWLLVKLSYEFEHPCYAKVRYSERGLDSMIELPNKASLLYNETGKFYLEINDKVKSEVTNENVKVFSKICPNCPCRSQCTLNLTNLNGKTSPEVNSGTCIDESLVNLTDSHGKKFKVMYDGTCKAYTKDNTSKEHCKHDCTEQNKLFVLKRNMTGNKFWDSKLLLKYKTDTDRNLERSIEFHTQQLSEEVCCIDFKTIVRTNYFEHFVRPYQKPYLCLSKHQPESSELVAYTTHRMVNVIPASDVLAPLFGTMYQAIQRTENKITDFESLFARAKDNSMHKRIDELINLQKGTKKLEAEQLQVKDIESIQDTNKTKVNTGKKKQQGSKNVIKRGKPTFKTKNEGAMPKGRKETYKKDVPLRSKIQMKIPFENELLECKSEDAEDFMEAVFAYDRWYSRLFRCSCNSEKKVAPYFKKTHCKPCIKTEYNVYKVHAVKSENPCRLREKAKGTCTSSRNLKCSSISSVSFDNTDLL